MKISIPKGDFLTGVILGTLLAFSFSWLTRPPVYPVTTRQSINAFKDVTICQWKGPRGSPSEIKGHLAEIRAFVDRTLYLDQKSVGRIWPLVGCVSPNDHFDRLEVSFVVLVRDPDEGPYRLISVWKTVNDTTKPTGETWSGNGNRPNEWIKGFEKCPNSSQFTAFLAQSRFGFRAPSSLPYHFFVYADVFSELGVVLNQEVIQEIVGPPDEEVFREWNYGDRGWHGY